MDFLTQAIVQEIELYECESEEGNPENEYDSTAARFDAIMDHHDANFCGREDFVANLTDVAATTQAIMVWARLPYSPTGIGSCARTTDFCPTSTLPTVKAIMAKWKCH